MKKQLETLQEMLMWRRPAGTRSERKFIKQYITPLGVNVDGYGNQIKRIGTAPVLWSCHTDTVHKEGGIQAVGYDGRKFLLPSKKISNCLGADDTAGVWLMCEMIKREVPGLYVFHREEECGSGGSHFIAGKTPALLADIKCAIALDRMGTADVITHQFGRCCSDTFARSLAAQLNNQTSFDYRPSSQGIFTDTANYTDAIGECTNLSVGYHSQHSSGETQLGEHALQLLDALTDLDVNALTFARKPGEETESGDWGWSCSENWASRSYSNGAPAFGAAKGWDVWDDADQIPHSKKRSGLVELVKDYPAEVADCLESYGIDEHELWSHIKEALFRPVK